MQYFKTLPQTLLGGTAHLGFCAPKIGLIEGVGGVPEFFSPLESSYFCELGAHAKFQNCSTSSSGWNGPFWLLSAQNRVNWGGRGGPRIFFSIGMFIFLWVRTPCKKLKSYDTPLCHFSNGGKKRRKIPKIVAYGCFDETVCTAPLGPK